MTINVVPDTYTTTEALEQIPGLTFRVLDYWLRTGAVTLVAEETPGSGGRRSFTKSEVRALRRIYKRYETARSELAMIRSGEAWKSEHDAKVSVVA